MRSCLFFALLLSISQMEVLVLASRRLPAAFLAPRTYGRALAGASSLWSGESPLLPQGALPQHRYFANPSYNKWRRKDADSSPDTVKKKKTYYKSRSKKPKTLFRAERVLANRSGKPRADCHKLLKKFAVFILEQDDDDDDEEEVDPTKMRVVSAKEKIPMTARLFVNKKFEVPKLPPLLMVFHKPKWMLSTMGEDKNQRRNLQDLNFAFSKHMHPVGRLDYDSSGLLLFSSSGQLTQTLLHPKFEKQKEYVVVVTGRVEEEALKERLKTGVELVDVQTRKGQRKPTLSGEDRPPEDSDNDDEEEEHNKPKQTFTTRAELLDVKHWPSSEVKPYLDDIRNNLPDEYNTTDLNLRGYMNVFDSQELSEIRLVVAEGKHRMVRRLLASCGHTVVDLRRERMGKITLGDDLPEGGFRNTTTEEEEWAEGLLGKQKKKNKK